MRRDILTVFTLFFAILHSTLTLADWRLDNEASDVYLLTTKNIHATEVSHFRTLSGKLEDSGNATLNIDLASIESQIPIRNERMSKFLFNVSKFPKAEITVKVDKQALKSLKSGDVKTTTVDADVKIHGKSQSMQAQMVISKDRKGAIIATSSQPLLINAIDFSLEAGVDKLKEIAKLANISYTVPVTFKLVYKPVSM